MKYAEHCKRAEEKFGKPFYIVHRWLDEFAVQDLPNHRRARHHLSGVEEVRKMWGEEAAQAAIQHIEDDMVDYGRIVPDAEWYDIHWVDNKNEQSK